MRMVLITGFAIFFCAVTGCSPKYGQFTGRYTFTAHTGVPDYDNPDFWASTPFKHDPSDSIPVPLLKDALTDSSVDVFFIHPTTFTDMDNPAWNAAIDDAAINAKTDYSTILYQASAFNEFRVFAPRYRQANLRAYFTKDTGAAKNAFDLAYADVRSSFQYYLDHYNNGRPIIIASHSQGTTHALRLLKEFFENSPLKN